MQHMNIGAVIARERRVHGLTQEELAARLGVTKAAVSKWELMQSLPDTALLPSIASQLSLTLDELFDWRDQLTDGEVDALGKEVRQLFDEQLDAGLARVESLAREHRGCASLLVRLAAETVGAATRQAAHMMQETPDDDDARVRLQETTQQLASSVDRLCAQAEDVCEDPGLAAQAVRVRAAAATLRGDHQQAVALLAQLHPADRPRVGTELASAQMAAGCRDDALHTLGECAQASAFELSSIASMLLTQVSSSEEMRAFVDAVEALDRAFDLSHSSAPALPALHIAAAATAHAQGDDTYACELLTRAATEVAGLEQGRIPESPRGARPNLLERPTDEEALGRMCESPSFRNYPATARQMMLDRNLWGDLVETEPYRQAVAPLG